MRRVFQLFPGALIGAGALAVLFSLAAISQPQARTAFRDPPASRDRAAECERKLQYIRGNGSAPQPDTRPTVLTEDEINACFAAGAVPLPSGVRKVTFAGAPGVVTAYARVDFEQITASQRSVNPLLQLLTGVHDIVAVADADGAGGVAVIRVRSVSLDGANIPRVALEYFLDRFVKPKHPEIGLDTRFRMPYRIDRAQVGAHTLTLRQK